MTVFKVLRSSVGVNFELGNGKFSLVRGARFVQQKNYSDSGWAPCRGLYFFGRVPIVPYRYLAAGWQCIGETKGFAKGKAGYQLHGNLKKVFVFSPNKRRVAQ